MQEKGSLISSRGATEGYSEKRARIIALDIIRGILIIIVAVDHFAWTPSLFIQFATDKSWFFASAAEGFFVISGMLVGYIYGPRLLSSFIPTTKRLWKRAALLYSLAIGFTFLFAFWQLWLPNGYPRLPFETQDTIHFIISTITLQYSYGWTSFLDRYAVFMFIAPTILWLIVKGKWYIAATTSALIWLIAQIYNIMPQFTAWQLLFVGGIIAGFYLPQTERWFRSLPIKRRKLIGRSLVISAFASYIGVILWLYGMQFAHTIASQNTLWLFHDLNVVYKFLTPYLDRDTLGIGRLIIGTLWFIGLFIFIRRYEKVIDRITHGLITMLGKNSLFVYSIHAVIIFLVDSAITPPKEPHLLMNTLLGILFVASLILFTVIKECYSRYTKARQL